MTALNFTHPTVESHSATTVHARLLDGTPCHITKRMNGWKVVLELHVGDSVTGLCVHVEDADNGDLRDIYIALRRLALDADEAAKDAALGKLRASAKAQLFS